MTTSPPVPANEMAERYAKAAADFAKNEAARAGDEYSEIILRSAKPHAGDSGRIGAIADKLKIDGDGIKRDVETVVKVEKIKQEAAKIEEEVNEYARQCTPEKCKSGIDDYLAKKSRIQTVTQRVRKLRMSARLLQIQNPHIFRGKIDPVPSAPDGEQENPTQRLCIVKPTDHFGLSPSKENGRGYGMVTVSPSWATVLLNAKEAELTDPVPVVGDKPIAVIAKQRVKWNVQKAIDRFSGIFLPAGIVELMTDDEAKAERANGNVTPFPIPSVG